MTKKNDPAHLDGMGRLRPIHDATSLPGRHLYLGCDSTRPLDGSPWQVTPSTIPGKDGGPVHHPGACPR